MLAEQVGRRWGKVEPAVPNDAGSAPPNGLPSVQKHVTGAEVVDLGRGEGAEKGRAGVRAGERTRDGIMGRQDGAGWRRPGISPKPFSRHSNSSSLSSSSPLSQTFIVTLTQLTSLPAPLTHPHHPLANMTPQFASRLARFSTHAAAAHSANTRLIHIAAQATVAVSLAASSVSTVTLISFYALAIVPALRTRPDRARTLGRLGSFR